MRSEADRVYLANKHRGGEANAKGGLYEDCYAVFQIVSCIAGIKRLWMALLCSHSWKTPLLMTF